LTETLNYNTETCILFGPARCSTDSHSAIIMHQSSLTATQAEISPSCRRSAHIKAYSASVVDSK
jgi:hypothetical protein